MTTVPAGSVGDYERLNRGTARSVGEVWVEREEKYQIIKINIDQSHLNYEKTS